MQAFQPLTRQLIGLTILAATILGFVAIHRAWSPGPGDDRQLVLVVDDASGLRAGAPIRHRGVTVGEVVAIDLDPTGRAVELRCVFRPIATPSLRTSSRFWIVRPVFLGLSSGASGLETLIRDPYVAYDTPAGASEPLGYGRRVPASSQPPRRPGDGRARTDGDLTCTVLFEESSGLEVDAEVRYRGLPVGTVDAIELLEDGRAVVVTATIRREFRSVIRRDAAFWVARPVIDIGLSGIRVQDLESIIRGAALEFGGGTGSPAPNDARFVGARERPKVDEDAEALAAVVRDLDAGNPRIVRGGAPSGSDSIVAVIFEVTESDPFSSDDFSFTSAGVLFRSADDRWLVAVPKSGLDAMSLVTDGIGEPEIESERITVVLGDGRAATAERVLTDPDHDLALIGITGDAGLGDLDPSGVIAPNFIGSSNELDGGSGDAIWFEGFERSLPSPILVTGDEVGHSIPVRDAAPLRGVVRSGGQLVGLVVQPSSDAPARFVPLGLVPKTLRTSSTSGTNR